MLGAVDIQLPQIIFLFADRGCFTVLLIYSCAGYAFALLIAVDVPPWSTQPRRSAVLSLEVFIAVDIKLYRAAGDIQLRQDCR